MLDPWLLWIESTAFSIWMREEPSIYAFPAVLAAHTIGLAFVAGLNVALDLRLLGLAPKVPPITFEHTTMAKALAAGADRIVAGADPRLYAQSLNHDSIAALHKDSYMKTLQARDAFASKFDPARVSVPTLVVCGEHDRLTPPSTSQAIADAIPGARLAVLPGAGHAPFLSRPGPFRDVLASFLPAFA